MTRRRQLHDRRRDPFQQLLGVRGMLGACGYRLCRSATCRREPGGYTCYDPTTGAKQICLDQQLLRHATQGHDGLGWQVQLREGVSSPMHRSPDVDERAEIGPTGFGGTRRAQRGTASGTATRRVRYNTVKPQFTQLLASRSVPSQRQVPDQRCDPLRQLHVRPARFGHGRQRSSMPT